MQNQQPQQGQLIERAGAGLPDLKTLSLEQFVDVFIERLKTSPEVLDLSGKVLAACARAAERAKAITNAADYSDAFAVLGTIATLVADGEEKRKAITRPIDVAKKRVMDVFGPDVELLANANTALRKAAATYKNEQDRKEREERERQEAVARAERQRLANEAEARRRAADAEAKQKRDAARKLEEEGRHREAARLNSAADSVVEKADAQAVNLERRAESVVAAPVAAAAPKVAGVSNREVWDFEVIDPKAVKPLYTAPDLVKIRGTVKLHKADAADMVGGIRVFPATDFNVKKR